MNNIQKIIKENNLIIPKEDITKKYDKDGNKVWEKYPDGRIWEYRYKDGNKVWEKYPDGRIWEYQYEDGSLVWKKLPSGEIWEYSYKDGNKVWEKYPNGTECWYEDNDILKLENGKYYLNGKLLEKQNK